MARKIIGPESGRSARGVANAVPPIRSAQPLGKSAGQSFSKGSSQPARQAGPVMQRQASAPSTNSFIGGGDPGLLPMGGDPGMSPMVAAPSEEDYLAGDSGFQTQMSALQGALQRYLADADFQRNNYTTDYNKSLRDLGYDEGTKAWNWNDELTASGRGYQNQLDDFGARGMLQSSGYADAFNELQRMLGQQYDSMSGAKTTFMKDLDNQTANYKAENTANSQAARAEALARRAAQYGL